MYRLSDWLTLLLAAVVVWLCPCAAGSGSCDFNCDNSVDMEDFSQLSKTWYQTLPWGPDGLPPQLLAYWRLDMNAQDSQSSFDGTVYGNPTWVSGTNAKVGSGAIYMDGEDYIAIETENFPVLPGSFTIDVWLKTNPASRNQTIISKGQSSWQIGIEGSSRKAFFSCHGLSPTSYLVGSTNLMDNQWHHLAAIYDHIGQTISLYVDETLDAQASAAGSVSWNDYNIWIGGDPQQPQLEYWWKGTLDNIRIFNYALSANEIFQRKTWHVDTSTGNDNSNGQGRPAALKTIQHALEMADSGDLILVWPGIYTESINFLGKAITLRSAMEPAAIRSPGDYALSFYSGEQADSVVENFIIKDSMVGVSISFSSPTLKQLTIINNEYAVDIWGYSFPTIQNSIFWYNTQSDIYTEAFEPNVSYCCIQRPVAGQCNISTNPLFVDPNNGDFHLQSTYGRCLPGAITGQEPSAWVMDSSNSPCIDAGLATLNPMQESLPNGGRVNMGAYGSTPFASKSPWPLKADTNFNGQVWIEDLEWFTVNWLFAEP
jgi:hypothetical protein